ncbi:MAG: M48 family metalloprotease [Magnetococcales bacterium]|nr:M48 family metalloprotease [Magnetococcales bacterium]
MSTWRFSSWLLLLTIAPLLLLGGCATPEEPSQWTMQSIADAPTEAVVLNDEKVGYVATVNRAWVRTMLEVHGRMVRYNSIPTHLYIVDGRNPNVFSWIAKNEESGEEEGHVAFNLGMIRFLKGDADQFAFLLGHEMAHNTHRHAHSSVDRETLFSAIGFAMGSGLSAVGIPMGDVIANLGLTLVHVVFHRGEEEEADLAGIRYAATAGYDPKAAITFHKRMLEVGGKEHFWFLSDHPTGSDRTELIQTYAEKAVAWQAGDGPVPWSDDDPFAGDELGFGFD